MSVRLTIRAAGLGICWETDEWAVLVALAALAAEPETEAEFFAAVRRYQPNHLWDETGQAAEIEASASEDGNWCLIDLPSRTVVAGSKFDLPDPHSAFEPGDDDDPPDGFHVVWLDTPRDWLFQRAEGDWLSVVAKREETLASQRRVETRSVLFGRPMLEFVAKQVVAELEAGPPDVRQRERIRAIHADWLMTARDDLLGRTPRQVLLDRHEQIDRDVQHRSEQWSMQGFAPPPLDVASAAYRFGGFGTTEIVLYFDLVRSLLEEAWTRVSDGVSNREILVQQLADHRDRYLDHPPTELSLDQTCNELIESERRRMPILDDGRHLDCDCPICRAQAEGAFGSGPEFMFFDSTHLEIEDEFAFSLTESRDEWEMEHSAMMCIDAQVEYELSKTAAVADKPESAWKSSSVDWDKLLGGGGSHQAAKLACGFPLAELVSHLKRCGAEQETIDGLNDAYAEFRRAEDRVAEQSAAEALRESLENVADAHPELVPRSADLQSRLDEVLRSSTSPARTPNWPAPRQEQTNAAIQPGVAPAGIPPLLNVVVFRSPGPADDEIEPRSGEHVEAVSPRPLAGGLGYLTLETDDFDRLAAGVAAGDATGTAAAALQFLGPQARQLIGRPRELGYCWTVTDETPFGRVLLLQVVPHAGGADDSDG